VKNLRNLFEENSNLFLPREVMYLYPGRIGLQAAKIVVREFKRDVIPAFEALIVYYSIASSTESVSP